MTVPAKYILTINGGSSSIKFAMYAIGNVPERQWHGQLDRIGQPGTSLVINEASGQQKNSGPFRAITFGSVAAPVHHYSEAIAFVIDWLEGKAVFDNIEAVGHRVVHGMAHTKPERITPNLLTELRTITLIDPDHLPGELALIEIIRTRYPGLLQIACFDTAFHRTLPRVAQLLPLPRRFDARGIRRYGFHGLSYTYLLSELSRFAGAEKANDRVILAHLGSGASLVAVQKGKSMDTTMGFTPTGGIMMGTRPGDLDPGTMAYLMQTEVLTPTQFNHIINHESGLLGVSETSSDIRALLASQVTDSRAAEAVELFCYQVKKGIGAYAAVLDGVDTLIFSGGIGENVAEVRTRICTGLGFLGIDIDHNRNIANAAIISTDTSRVTVRIIPTDEEQIVAEFVLTFIS